MRKQLGSLNLLTVQPATSKRYDKAVDGFLQFLRSENLVLPTDKRRLDPLVCDYLKHLWSSGKGRGQACDTLAGLQDMQPGLRNHMPAAWRLLRTWQHNEIPSRAPPLPEHVVHAMAGWAIFNNHHAFGLSLLIGHYCMLRTGEILGLLSNHIECANGSLQSVIGLGFTKGGKRRGAAESVVLGLEPIVHRVKEWKRGVNAGTSLTPFPPKWRQLFNQALEKLGIGEFQFRPYSLRPGGATFFSQKHQNLDRILVQGRWHTQKSARLYINEGLAVLAQMHLSPQDPRLRPYLLVYRNFLLRPTFPTLEPPVRSFQIFAIVSHRQVRRCGSPTVERTGDSTHPGCGRVRWVTLRKGRETLWTDR